MIDVQVQGTSLLTQQIAAITPFARDRQALARRLGRKVRLLAKRRVKKQQNLDGTAFAPRKNMRIKRKLLEWIYERSAVFTTPDGAKVTFKGKAAEFAYQQQFGVGADWTAVKAAKERPQRAGEPATRGQAQALIREGFKVGGKRKGWRVVSVSWIEKNMTQAQAGWLLRKVFGYDGRATAWSDAPPRRVALGVSDKEAATMLNQLARDATNSLSRRGTL